MGYVSKKHTALTPFFKGFAAIKRGKLRPRRHNIDFTRQAYPRLYRYLPTILVGNLDNQDGIYIAFNKEYLKA